METLVETKCKQSGNKVETKQKQSGNKVETIVENKADTRWKQSGCNGGKQWLGGPLSLAENSRHQVRKKGPRHDLPPQTVLLMGGGITARHGSRPTPGR